MQAYQEAIDFLDHIGKYSTHPGIENSERLLEALDHPERDLKIIHVAGTNGKGSVCAFLADMLTAQGYRTGLFVSPHLVDLRERIQLDRKMIGIKDFSIHFLAVKQAAQQLAQEGYTGITYFDYLFATALCWYKEQSVDYAVIETGLGGRLDSTNALKSPLLSIITSISFDHTELLGDTITKIAAEKAGIIKPGIPLIYCADEPDACKVIIQAAKENGTPHIGIGRRHCKWFPTETADTKKTGQLQFMFCLPAMDCLPLTLMDGSFTDAYKEGIHEILTVNSPALYQAENAAMAFTAALWLFLLTLGAGKETSDSKKKNLTFYSAPMHHRLENFYAILKDSLTRSVWEGRFEQVLPNCYLDGAHNADGIRMLLASFRPIAAGKKATLLFAAVKEKDTEEMIREICESGLFCRYLVTTVGGARAIAEEQLKETFQKYTDSPVMTYLTPQDAFLSGLQYMGGDGKNYSIIDQSDMKDQIFLCAGSLYLVGLIKEYLLSQSIFSRPGTVMRKAPPSP
ncbi:MAG: hypothetical protein K2N63_02665 [Lachnospiraceae bacterium]|nr:hypothetical protein [Lachnospiraceae bacterium]